MSWFQDWLRSRKKPEEVALTPVSTVSGTDFNAEEEKLVLPINGDELADGDGPAPVSDLTAAELPKGFTTILPVASVWKRKPPKKEVVRIERVWWMSPLVRSTTSRINDVDDNGWTVRAVPVRGGRPIVAEAQWFLDNYDDQGSSD